jgi:hypothetical protein
MLIKALTLDLNDINELQDEEDIDEYLEDDHPITPDLQKALGPYGFADAIEHYVDLGPRRHMVGDKHGESPPGHPPRRRSCHDLLAAMRKGLKMPAEVGATAGRWSGPRTIAEFAADMEAIFKEYPTIIKLDDINTIHTLDELNDFIAMVPADVYKRIHSGNSVRLNNAIIGYHTH